MIKFEALIKVIHDAAISANKALMEENLKLIDQYFESSEEREIIGSSLDEALQATKRILRKKRPTKEELERVMQCFIDAKEALQDETSKDEAKKPDALRPKTVVIQYPEQTATGVVMTNVRVPLVTLIPISVAQISKLKFKTHLEIIVEDDELKVSFPPRGGTVNPSEETDICTLEVTIEPREGPEGLKQLIQGFEKVLRAQIPN